MTGYNNSKLQSAKIHYNSTGPLDPESNDSQSDDSIFPVVLITVFVAVAVAAVAVALVLNKKRASSAATIPTIEKIMPVQAERQVVSIPTVSATPTASTTPAVPATPAASVTSTHNFCSNCGTPIKPGANFCHKCGYELNGQS